MWKNKGNRKVKNATKVDIHGNKIENIKEWRKSHKDDLLLDSTLELYFKNLLEKSGIKYEFKKKIEIFPKFTLKGKNYQSCSWNPDFFLNEHNVIIDTKGNATDTFRLKYRMLLYSIHQQKSPPDIYFVRNKKQADIFILLVRSNKPLDNFIYEKVFGVQKRVS
jgi:hypothetical protein